MSKKDFHTCVGHKAAILVAKSPVRILAGGKMPGTPIPLGATIVALGVGLESPITGLPGLESRVVRVDWPDMSTPNIDADGWKRIARALAALRKPIYVSCSAGHGRTGTCLAILTHMLGQMPKKADPVEWVRGIYCPSAVETAGQIAYVEKITGRASTAKASQGWSQGASYTGSQSGGSYTGYSSGSKDYHEGEVWDVKTSSWKPKGSETSKKFDFETPKAVTYCKGQGDKCPKVVKAPARYCEKCQDKEGLNADGSRKSDAGAAATEVIPRGTFPPMPVTGKEAIKQKYFPDQGGADVGK